MTINRSKVTEDYIRLASRGQAQPTVWQDQRSPGDWYWTDDRGYRSPEPLASPSEAKRALAQHLVTRHVLAGLHSKRTAP